MGVFKAPGITTAQRTPLVLAEREIVFDTDLDALFIGDGATAGGLPISADVAWGGITGTLSAQADLQTALNAKQATLVSATNIKTVNGASLLGAGDLTVNPAGVGTRISDDYASQNTYGLLEALKITAGRFSGAWRERDIGAIKWYFTCSAMVLGKDYFTAAQRKAAVETAIDKGVVSPRANSAAYSQYAFVTFPSQKIYFCNIPGTTAASAPSDAGVTLGMPFLGDGSVTWEWTGLTAPAGWSWFLIDITSGLFTPQGPDSNDAYAGMLAAAAYEAGVDAAWLAATTAHGGQTRLQVIDALMQNCCTDELNGISPGPRLAQTFQNGLNFSGAAYTVRFLADNVEVWRGYVAQAALQAIAGASNAAALQNAADVRSGILALFTGGRFQTYEGQPSHTAITGNAAFATDFRFHLWPALHGMLVSLSDWQTYGDAVCAYIRDNVPGLFTAALDTFPLSEAYVALADKFAWEEAQDTLLWRTTSRAVANVTIVDAVLTIRRETNPEQVAGGGGGGGITALTGDVTASGTGSVAATIAADAVTNAKLANMATQTFKGRTTAGTGDPEDLTVAQAKTLLNLAGTNSGDQTITLTGDVTGSGTGSFAATIANNAVSFAKLADIGTDTLIGRDTAGTGDPEAITVTGGIEFSGAGSIRTSAFTGDVTKTAGGTALTIAANAVDNTKAADMAANTIKANATAATADPADLAVGTNTVIGRVAGNIVAAQVVTAQISANAADNTILADMATARIKGRVTAGTGDPEDLTGTQATTLLDTFTSTLKGLAPASGGGTTNFLRADGTWAAPSGGGGGSFDYGINAAMSGLCPY